MKKLYLLTLILAIFASCSTTSDVVSNKRIQKRKYTKGFNIKSQNKNNHNLALKDQSSSVYSSVVYLENNDNTNTDLIFASKEGVIIEQSIANQALRTDLKNLNSILIKEKKSTKTNKSINPVLLKDLKKEFKSNKKELKKDLINTNSLVGDGEEPKVHWAALTGMICGILGLLVTPFLFATLGIIFGGIGLSKIKKNPEKYKGKGMAVTGLVTGIVAIVIVWAVVGLLLATF
jgi:hypothetical protein